ncbi:DUF5999 family protein [Streptomyces malaysiensis]|uniref:DUF5999 family protein n=1 Tax=Streptomyces malaysiensis TaxID=92644 RepID=UPI000BFE22F0|nr:DUF5999 family protein [Streptomyces malaysiensis]ATL88760.1 resistance-nodulation-cell division (RND) efflux membrane fusion protein precursor [Streptomyces malaysiensis]
MRRLIHTVRTWWGEVLGVVCVVEDITATVRSLRASSAENKELAAAERTVALRQARQGCTHSPACPPTNAPDRQKAAVVYEDAQFTYLCNGIVLSIKAPDYPSFVLPETEAARDA